MNSQEKYPFFVSTIVPAMNEEGNIAEFCRLYAEMMAKAPFDSEVVFVDDGSSDSTLTVIKENAKKYPFVRYASHQSNRGLTEALQTGFGVARGDVYVFYPADLQYVPADIPTLVQPIAEGADISTGWKQGKYQKKFVSTVYNWLSRKIFDLKVHDLNSVKAFKREVVERIFLRRDWHRYLVVLGAAEGYHVEEVKIPLYDRTWGKSKFSVFRIPVGVLDMLAVKFQITFLKKPLLYFGGFGLILILLAFPIGLWALYERFVLEHGNRLYVLLVIFLAGMGLGLFMMGLVVEVQTALKEELADLRKQTRSILQKLNNSSR